MTLIDKLINEHNQAVQYLEESSEKDGFLNGMKNAVKIAKNHSDWVSVDDKLPKHDDFYLVHQFNGHKDEYETTIKWFNTKEQNFLEWDFQDEVTHWQPLPKPPKGV